MDKNLDLEQLYLKEQSYIKKVFWALMICIVFIFALSAFKFYVFDIWDWLYNALVYASMLPTFIYMYLFAKTTLMIQKLRPNKEFYNYESDEKAYQNNKLMLTIFIFISLAAITTMFVLDMINSINIPFYAVFSIVALAFMSLMGSFLALDYLTKIRANYLKHHS